MKPMYIKVPTELAQFALSERKVRPLQVYLATKFLYSGKANQNQWSPSLIADFIDGSVSSVHKSINWLLERNWMGKDPETGWTFFRGLDQIHRLESWQFARAAIMNPEDVAPLKRCKAFFIGAVLLSLVTTGRQGVRTGPLPRGPKPSHYPVSLSVLAKVLGVSQATAYRYRRMATDQGYIKNEENLIQIKNWTPSNIHQFKYANIEGKIPIELLEYSDRRVVSIDRVRLRDGHAFLQEPNLIFPLIILKSRRGLSKY